MGQVDYGEASTRRYSGPLAVDAGGCFVAAAGNDGLLTILKKGATASRLVDMVSFSTRIMALAWAPPSMAADAAAAAAATHPPPLLAVASLGDGSLAGGLRVFAPSGGASAPPRSALRGQRSLPDANATSWAVSPGGESLALVGSRGRALACCLGGGGGGALRVASEFAVRGGPDVVALGAYPGSGGAVALVGARNGSVYAWDIRETTRSAPRLLTRVPSCPVALLALSDATFLVADAAETAAVVDARFAGAAGAGGARELARLAGYQNTPARLGVAVGAGGRVAAAQRGSSSASAATVRIWEPPCQGGLMAARGIFSGAELESPSAVAFLPSTVDERLSGGAKALDAWPALLVADGQSLRRIEPRW
jgi:hypothetical protein